MKVADLTHLSNGIIFSYLLIYSFFYLTLQQFCSAQEPRRGLRIKRESGESPVQSRCCEP